MIVWWFGERSRRFSWIGSRTRACAAALLGDPPVLLFDEPINGLDPDGIRRVQTFMRRLAADGRSVLVSSRLTSEMALMAERLVVIGKGRPIADTDVASFISARDTGQVVLGCPQLERLSGLIATGSPSMPGL